MHSSTKFSANGFLHRSILYGAGVIPKILGRISFVFAEIFQKENKNQSTANTAPAVVSDAADLASALPETMPELTQLIHMASEVSETLLLIQLRNNLKISSG